MHISLIIPLLAGLSTLIGTIPIFIKIKKEHINKFIVLSLSISLSIMLMISISELIPESIIYISAYNSRIKSIIIILLSLFSGIIIVKLLINKLENITTNNLLKLGILNMIVLMLHNIPEGMATYISTYKSTELGIKIATSIILHNIPEGIAIALPIYYATNKKYLAIGFTLISGLSEFLGAIIIAIFFKDFISYMTLSIILLVVGGIMTSLAINKLYPEALKYNHNKILVIGIILGVILSILISFI